MNRKLISILISLAVLVAGAWLIVGLSRVGETRVSLDVIPKNAQVKINGVESKTGTHYLKPGTYTFSASLDGWKTDSQEIKITKPTTVGLIPSPDSVAATELLQDQPELQLERERIGGQRAGQISQALSANNPIIDILPYTEPSGPFSIDYGLSKTDKTRVFLLISDSSPNGRVNALKWLRQQGQDPTNIEMVFSDFINPLEGGEHKH